MKKTKLFNRLVIAAGLMLSCALSPFTSMAQLIKPNDNACKEKTVQSLYGPYTRQYVTKCVGSNINGPGTPVSASLSSLLYCTSESGTTPVDIYPQTGFTIEGMTVSPGVLSYVESLWGSQLFNCGSSIRVWVKSANLGAYGTCSGCTTTLASTSTVIQQNSTLAGYATGDVFSQAEANFLDQLLGTGTTGSNTWGGSSINASTSSYDMIVELNNQVPWKIGASIPGHFDLPTVLGHEIGHGLGFITGAETSATGLLYLDNFGSGNATIYDEMIWNGTTPYLPAEASGLTSSAFYTWATHDDLSFDYGHAVGPFGMLDSPPANPGVYSPNPWAPGSSVAHITASGAIMVYNTIYNNPLVPTLQDVEVLGDIGWCPRYWDGCNVYIKTPDLSYGNCDAAPPQLLSCGSSYKYCLDPELCATGPFSSHPWPLPNGTWYLELYSSDAGIVDFAGPSNTDHWYSLTVPSTASLSGHIWKRDVSGNILGQVVYKQSYHGKYVASLRVGVYYPVQSPFISGVCAGVPCVPLAPHQIIYYGAPGATSYAVSYRHDYFGVPVGPSGSTSYGYWSNWSTPETTANNVFSYEFGAGNDAINGYDNYEFQMTAIGATGEPLESQIITRNHALNWVEIYPNPASVSSGSLVNIAINRGGATDANGNSVDATSDGLINSGIIDATLGMDGLTTGHSLSETSGNGCAPVSRFVIGNVTLTNIAFPSIRYNYNFGASGGGGAVTIRTVSVQPGNYAVTITDVTNTATASSTIVIAP